MTPRLDPEERRRLIAEAHNLALRISRERPLVDVEDIFSIVWPLYKQGVPAPLIARAVLEASAVTRRAVDYSLARARAQNAEENAAAARRLPDYVPQPLEPVSPERAAVHLAEARAALRAAAGGTTSRSSPEDQPTGSEG